MAALKTLKTRDAVIPMKVKSFDSSIINQLHLSSYHKAFSTDVMRALIALSRKWVKSDNSEIAALGFWLRKSNLQRMKEEFSGIEQVQRAGTVFHIAPSNVDTIFAYSWALSFLLGNKNLVRISQRAQATTLILLKDIELLLKSQQFNELGKGQLFFSYKHEESINLKLAEFCDIRAIWGGDDTVAKLSKIKLKSGAHDVHFHTKYSACAVSALKVKNAPERFVSQLLKTGLAFEQQACTSPKMIIWFGDENDIAQAKQRVCTVLESDIELPLSVSNIITKKLSLDFSFANDSQAIYSDPFYRLNIVESPINSITQLLKMHSGQGLFISCNEKEFRTVMFSNYDKFQTLGLYGLGRDEVLPLYKNLDFCRLVPMEKMHEFSHHWDGMNLLEQFCVSH